MKDLASYVEIRDSVKVVDSRKIHEFLEVKTQHSKWIVRKIEELSLAGGVDFQLVTNVRLGTRSNGSGKSIQKVYYLTQRAAEHLGMAETTEKGVEIRDAFIKARDTAKKLLESEFDRKSKETRKNLADHWAKHGLQGKQFGIATRKEYEVAFGDEDLVKKEMDHRQKAVLTIFETMEMLKLDDSPHIQGLDDVCESLEETGKALTGAFQKLRINQNRTATA